MNVDSGYSYSMYIWFICTSQLVSMYMEVMLFDLYTVRISEINYRIPRTAVKLQTGIRACLHSFPIIIEM